MNYYKLFEATLANQYRQLFTSNPVYAQTFLTTPHKLAAKITRTLVTCDSDITDKAIVATCKLLKIKCSSKGIQTFLQKVD
jgi:hypothetical protein